MPLRNPRWLRSQEEVAFSNSGFSRKAKAIATAVKIPAKSKMVSGGIEHTSRRNHRIPHDSSTPSILRKLLVLIRRPFS